MKLKYIYILLCLIATSFTGCTDDEGRMKYPFSQPEIYNLEYSIPEEMEANNDISFSLDIKDPETPLSTLEIELSLDGKVLYTESVRTKDYQAHIDKHTIHIPFTQDFEGGPALLKLTAINVEGSEQIESKTFVVKRPQVPQTLYLHYEGKIIELNQSKLNPFEYISEDGEFPEIFSGKISSSKELADSKLIWGYSETTNSGSLITPDGDGFSFNFTNWIIQSVKFNTFTFKLGIIGHSSVDAMIKGVPLEMVDGYYQASIEFEQGEEVEVYGIEDLEGAYNRDFFEYNAETGKLKFLQESGYWNVYYSDKYNYMWIARMDDVGPAAYWLVGHGFTAASVWHEDYDNRGWDLDDISGMAYAVKIADNKYQTTVYLSDTHYEGNFDLQLYAERTWTDKLAIFNETSFSGDTEGIKFGGSVNGDIMSADGFVPGYFQLTFDISNGLNKAKVHFKRLSN